MSKARIEILRMIAEGKVSPEDGARLLDALEDGEAGGRTRSSTRTRETARDAAENLGKALEEAARAVKSAAVEGVRVAHKVLDEHRPETELVRVENNRFEIPHGGILRVQPALRVSIGGGSAGGAVTVRGIAGNQARVLEGSAVEVHRNGNAYIITWAKSELVLEVPETVARLVVRSFGNVDLSEYDTTFRIESFGGNVTVLAPRAPFKIRALGGSVRVQDLLLREGSSAIRATGGDIEVQPAPAAAVEILASATLGGELELPKGAVRSDTRTGRKGVITLGAGTGKLELDTLSGRIRVRADHLTAETAADTAHRAGSEEGRSTGAAPEAAAGAHTPEGDRAAALAGHAEPDAAPMGTDDDPDPWTADWYDDQVPGGRP